MGIFKKIFSFNEEPVDPLYGFEDEDESEDDDYITINGDDIPVGCAACGGPYPMCAESCPMFDD